MSDEIDEARIKIKKLAASMLVRKEKLEAEVARVEKDLARAENDPELSAELAGLLEAKNEELAIAESDYSGALKEMEELKKLDRDFEVEKDRAVVRGGLSSDPFLKSPAE